MSFDAAHWGIRVWYVNFPDVKHRKNSYFWSIEYSQTIFERLSKNGCVLSFCRLHVSDLWLWKTFRVFPTNSKHRLAHTCTVFYTFLLHFAGVASRCTRTTTTALSMIAIPESEMSANQLEIKKIQDKWGQVRLMDKSQIASIEPEWKEAYNRFFEKYDSDMQKMTDIATKLEKMIEPPKVEKKTKGQRKRDAWAKVQARAAARAANK
jgi:hypothetical protein